MSECSQSDSEEFEPLIQQLQMFQAQHGKLDITNPTAEDLTHTKAQDQI
jgi:hypothetical protein